MSIGLCRVEKAAERRDRTSLTTLHFALCSIDKSQHASFVRLLHRIFFCPFLFFLLVFRFGYFHQQSTLIILVPPESPSIIMTSSSPTPDIGSLSLSSQPPHQRLHDTYDYDGTGNVRPTYHFATSPPLPPSQPPFQPLSMNQSPVKPKTPRAALPSVRSPFFPFFFCTF